MIGHRGASGYRPEHTLESYDLAIQQGVDFIEPDLVATRDGVLIARHENLLAEVELDAARQIVMEAGRPKLLWESTDIAQHGRFVDYLSVKKIEGRYHGGWFSEDLLWSEIEQLRARERIPQIRPDNALYNDRYKIPTTAHPSPSAQSRSST